MSYLVLARKWRPRVFDDLVGQEPISRILINAITQGKIAHAYLFSGPRGVGKTSTARILAKALNCEKGPLPVPCGTCASCREIADGSSMDVMEIDGASNNSVNDIRDLRERVKYAPAGGKYKVYIIDEAHMLSDSAFNALLKTLEEPPSHVVFVLATTAARKIPATVLSRCQHLPFRRVSTQKIKERLRLISESEGIHISDSALDMIGRAAEGSMRDSLTILDQVSAFSSDIQEEEVKDLLGITDFKALSELASAVIGGDRKRILEIITELADIGIDFKSFSKDFMNFFRDLLVAKVVGKPEEMLDMSDNEMGVIREILKGISEDSLTVLLSEMIRTESEVRIAFSPRIALEMSLLRSSFLSDLRPLREAIENIESLMGEKKGPSKAGDEAREVSERRKTDERVHTGIADTKRAQTKGPEDSLSMTASKELAEKALPENGPGEQASTVPTAAPSPPSDTAILQRVEEIDEHPSSPADSFPGREEERKDFSITMDNEESSAPSQKVLTERDAGNALNPPLAEGDFWGALIERVEAVNHPLACRLSEADGRVDGDALIITFNGGTAIHADSIKKNQQVIEKIASEFMGKKIAITIDTVKKKIPRKKEIKEKVLSDPVVREAIELFDGRIVDIKPIENGGRDV